MAWALLAQVSGAAWGGGGPSACINNHPGDSTSHSCHLLGFPTSQAQGRLFILSSRLHATPRYVYYCPQFTDGNFEAQSESVTHPRSQVSQEVELSLEPNEVACGTPRGTQEVLFGCAVHNLPNCTWETPPG